MGTLEAELAERVALLTWRLRRVIRYETAVTTAGISNAAARVRSDKDEENPRDAILSSRGYRRTHATVRQELANALDSVSGFATTRDEFRRLYALTAETRVRTCNHTRRM